MRRHVLVTNDFPPKIGGIQQYLWELWRRLPPDSFAVYTTPYAGAATFDAGQAFQIERSPEPVIGPYPWLRSRLDAFAAEQEADLILLDPAVPLGAIGPYLDRPYGVVLHGAEVTIPGRLPLSRSLLARVLDSAALVVAAGHYPLAEAERCAGRTLPSVVIPPGVDHERFQPLADNTGPALRASFDLHEDDFVVATVNRLVPRKGMDTLIRAAALLAERNRNGNSQGDPALDLDGRRIRVVIGGTGRHERELRGLVERLDAPVTLLGRIPDDEVVRLYQTADAMAMLCNERWFGLEQEGFGIVFLEAAAVGIPQVAGRSGGAHEAVEDGVTGIVVDEPRDPRAVASALAELARDGDRSSRMGEAARRRVVDRFDYDHLAERLWTAIAGTIDGLQRR